MNRSPAGDRWIEQARAVPIENEIERAASNSSGKARNLLDRARCAVARTGFRSSECAILLRVYHVF
jgi:hypothetical protein